MEDIRIEQDSLDIRPDIARISEMKITMAGKCWLHAFTIGTIKHGIDTLKQEQESTQMNEKDKWYTLFSACKNYATDRNIRINWKLAYQMLKEHNVTKDDLEYEGNTQTTTTHKREFTPEEWKDQPTDRIAYAHKCHEYEEQRAIEGHLKFNPYWTYMFPTWKKRLMDKFPILKEIYPRDVALCNGLQDLPEVEYPHAVTDSEHAENIICNMKEDLDNYKRMGIGLTKQMPPFNPWWDKLDQQERQTLLIKYPWYAQYVSKTPNAEEFYKKMAETIGHINEANQ